MKPLSMKPLTQKDLERTGHERSPIELSVPMRLPSGRSMRMPSAARAVVRRRS
jgi:hypothetical protein